MRRILPLILCVIAGLQLTAQTGAPQKMNYQAVARNAAGAVLSNQNIGVKAEILDSDQTNVVYAETHTTTTNQFGLFTLQVGGGTVVSGNFSNINWGSGNKFLRTSVDLTGGSNYQLMGVSQLLSVPYALYAQNVVNNGGKPVITFSDTITNGQAQAQLAAEYGPNTEQIIIINCDKLTSVDLSVVKRLSKLIIVNNPRLNNVNLSGLTECTGEITIDGCPNIAVLNFNSLQRISNYSLPDVNLWYGGYSAESFPVIITHTKVSTLNFPALRRIYGDFILVENNSLQTLNFPVLETVENNKRFTIQGCHQLSSVSLPTLKKATLEMVDLPSLVSLSAPMLQSAQYVRIWSTGLPNLNLPALQDVKSFDFSASPTTSISVPELKTAETFSVRYTKISSLTLPSLSNTGGLGLDHDSSLTNVNLPALDTIGAFGIQNNPTLTTITFNNLSSLTSKHQYFDANSLPSTQINDLLAKFVAMTPAITGHVFHLDNQSPLAPPTGQGITDKATLKSQGNNVATD